MLLFCLSVGPWLPLPYTFFEYASLRRRLTFDQAKAACEAENAALAVILDQDEQDFLITFLRNIIL